MLLFIYFGNFSQQVHSFNHITTSSLKFDVIFEFSAIKMRLFRVCDTVTVCMHSKYINSNCGHKFVTRNGFSNPDFL